MERMLISGLLVACLAYWGLKSSPLLANSWPEFTTQWFNEPSSHHQALMEGDTVKPGKPRKNLQTIVEDDGEQQVELKMENNRVTNLTINGKQIPESNYEDYADLIDRLKDSAPAAPLAPISPLAPIAPVPPIPPMPAFPGTWMHPPHAPASPKAPGAPAPRGFSWMQGDGGGVISVDKNSDDQTVIMMNQSGKPTKIEVKDGKVWINGAEVEEGKSIQLHNGNDFWLDGSGTGIFLNSDGDAEGLAAELEAQQEAWQDYAQAWQEHAEEWQHLAEEHRNHSEALGAEAREQMAREMEEAGIHFKAPPAEGFHFEFPKFEGPHFEPGSFNFNFDSNSFSTMMVEELKRDQLITDPDDYSVSLSAKRLKVNGKKQPANLHKKYLQLYREHTGHEMNNKDEISFSVKR